MRGDMALWSLSYEVWFYILGGALACLSLSKILGSGAGLASALAVLLIGLSVFSVLDASLLFCWGLGAMAYIMAAHLNSLASALAGVVVALAGCALLAKYAPAGISGAHDVGERISFLVLAGGFSLLLPWLVCQRPRCKLVASLEVVGGRLAAFSYTLYLTNFPVLDIMNQFNGRIYSTTSLASYSFFFLKITVCLCAAWLLYLPFERQTGTVRKWLRKVLGLDARKA